MANLFTEAAQKRSNELRSLSVLLRDSSFLDTADRLLADPSAAAEAQARPEHYLLRAGVHLPENSDLKVTTDAITVCFGHGMNGFCIRIGLDGITFFQL